MRRLLDIAATPPRAIAYHIEFTWDIIGRPRIEGRVEGTVRLVCQRCLEEFDWSVVTEIDAVVVDEEKDANERDTVVGNDGRIVLETVIEDELLLALPNAPIHPFGTCDAPPVQDTGDPGAVERSSPFAALEALRDGNDWPRSP